MMITASHNPGCDNGLKLVDPSGRMLAMECEEELTKIANGTEEEFEKFKNEEVNFERLFLTMTKLTRSQRQS